LRVDCKLPLQNVIAAFSNARSAGDLIMASLSEAVLNSALIDSAPMRGALALYSENMRDAGLQEFTEDGRTLLIAFGHDRKTDLRGGVVERVRQAFENLGADQVEFAENERSWVFVGRCDRPDAIEDIRTAVWLNTDLP
jgi:hypothetical protein